MKHPHSREDPAFTRKTLLSENRKSDFFFHYFSPTVIYRIGFLHQNVAAVFFIP